MSGYSVLTASRESRAASLVNEDKGNHILANSNSVSFYRAAAEESNTLLFTHNRFAKYIVVSSRAWYGNHVYLLYYKVPKRKRSEQIRQSVEEIFFKGGLNLPNKHPGVNICEVFL